MYKIVLLNIDFENLWLLTFVAGCIQVLFIQLNHIFTTKVVPRFWKEGITLKMVCKGFPQNFK